ncbi:DeoR/GlpR family DNA-binding transcription regulator [Danxiaibacter flavus]|uniref:DeoR/GlpR family DNA-binding transcription regulator n=1 Tax=Danxiaibacter flavus TaxID=3049108 RepID=A0ABV3ZEA3_9BACT|nr:DeoR/GlpR family DNA-binding transcription regulator [Chitinophagaceae bacterium DXS]
MMKLSMSKRHAYILDKLSKEKEIRVIDLSEELEVSPVTIRKDLKQLETKKLLFKSHGSITQQNPYIQDIHVNEKELINIDQKIRIAQKAAELIVPNDAIIIASGTSVLQLALLIEAKEQLTVLTSAINVAMALIKKPDIEVIQLGGIIRKTSTSVSGPFAQQMLTQFACSKLFLGVDGIDIQYGCTTSNMMEANINQSMIQAAEETIILTDSSKFGKRGFGRICNFDQVDRIITDSGVSERTVKSLEDMGVEVMVV